VSVCLSVYQAVYLSFSLSLSLLSAIPKALLPVWCTVYVMQVSVDLSIPSVFRLLAFFSCQSDCLLRCQSVYLLPAIPSACLSICVSVLQLKLGPRSAGINDYLDHPSQGWHQHWGVVHEGRTRGAPGPILNI
jgi:hypothetical protein